KLYYWFNPVNGTSSAGDGIIDNMITGTEAANNVGVIFKIDNKPIIFYDAETYSFAKAQASQNFTFTADYYRMSDNSAEVSSGHVKAMEGANKQVISSQADSLIKISRIWADFFPANTSNQPI
ncbi:hypothetical protein JTL95_33555, partial [Pseudomonas aeruginosa]|nr:hypothetical protein [Pseudomonas aeruginosa]